MAQIPDGFFLKGMLFWGESLSRETIVSKGVYLEPPDLSCGSVQSLCDFQDQVRIFLGLINDDMAVQVQWSVDSDYRAELERYHRITLEKAKNPWTTYTRNERYARYTYLMERGLLRRERLAVFFSRKCNTIPNGGLPAVAQITRFLDQQARNFDEVLDTIGSVFTESRLRPMTDEEHYYYFRRFLNPSLALKTFKTVDRYEGYDANSSILENCLRSDGIALKHDDMVAFKLDDYYHSQFIVRRWPRQTMPGLIHSLTSAVMQEYCITMNIYPINVQREIKKEEDMIARLEGDMIHNKKYSLKVSIAKKHRKVEALMMGYTIPFHVLTVIRCWDQSIEGLQAKNAAIKTALQGMNGCQYHQCNHEAQARNVFYETFPGWTGGKVREWDLYAESDYLVDLLPLSNTFTGALETGEALYDGNMGNILGVESFTGNTPQNFTLIGITGAGKSVMMTDFLSQSECMYDFTAIIEEGLSYATYTQLMGSQPIVLTPDAQYTINYLDTLGLPLTTSQVANGSTLCLKMIGASADEDKNNRRSALLSKYIQHLYWEAYEDWRKDHEREFEEACVLAFLCEEHRKLRMGSDATFVDAFLEIQDFKQNDGAQYAEWVAGISKEKVLAFSKEPSTAMHVRNTAFSFFKRADYQNLTHSSLVETMRYAPIDDDDPTELNFIADMLAAWTRDEGRNGVLFDGITNLQITGNIVHFELGRIPESARELKEAAGFLVSNYIRQHIVTLPRGQRKRVIFEEVARFVNIPGADRILSEFYSQLRKYGCWCISIFQQYGQLANSPLKRVIFANSKGFLFMRQNSREDIEDIANEVDLPDSMRRMIKNYPMPEHQHGDKAAYVCYFVPGGGRAGSGLCGTVKNIVSTEMLYVARSDGEHFDKRQKSLSQYASPLQGVLREAALPEKSEAALVYGLNLKTNHMENKVVSV